MIKQIVCYYPIDQGVKVWGNVGAEYLKTVRGIIGTYQNYHHWNQLWDCFTNKLP